MEVIGYCSCQDCTDRTSDLYRMQATCLNCKSEFIGVFRKGDGTHSLKCPACGVNNTTFGAVIAEPNFEQLLPKE